MKAPGSDKDAPFIETPNGIFTAAGNWFHTTEASLQAYAGPVLDLMPVKRLIYAAELWLRSPATLVLWCTPFLLWKLGILPTLLLSLALYLCGSIWGPVLVSETARPVLKVMDNVMAQAILYIVLMSWFAISGQLWLMGAGLFIFIVIRWGLLKRITDSLLHAVRKRMYRVPYEDQILKSVIVRASMKHRTALPELDRMEQFILSKITKKK